VSVLFNLSGRDNLTGGTGGNFIDNALFNSFGGYTVAGARQEAERGRSVQGRTSVIVLTQLLRARPLL
jgi:hypothetical protein